MYECTYLRLTKAFWKGDKLKFEIILSAKIFKVRYCKTLKWTVTHYSDTKLYITEPPQRNMVWKIFQQNGLSSADAMTDRRHAYNRPFFASRDENKVKLLNKKLKISYRYLQSHGHGTRRESTFLIL